MTKRLFLLAYFIYLCFFISCDKPLHCAEGWYDGTFVRYKLDSSGVTESHSWIARAKFQIISEEEYNIYIYEDETVIKTYIFHPQDSPIVECSNYYLSYIEPPNPNFFQGQKYLQLIDSDSLKMREQKFKVAINSGYGDYFYGRKE